MDNIIFGKTDVGMSFSSKLEIIGRPGLGTSFRAFNEHKFNLELVPPYVRYIYVFEDKNHNKTFCYADDNGRREDFSDRYKSTADLHLISTIVNPNYADAD